VRITPYEAFRHRRVLHISNGNVRASQTAQPSQEGNDMSHVKIPAKAVADDNDVLDPLTKLLRGINLQGDEDETEKAGKVAATFGGPPQSVALIEAGATAANKWWSAGLGAAVVATWSSVVGWWGGADTAVKQMALLAAAIATAAAIIAIGYLLGSDVRARGAAAVATIQARARLAEAMVQASQAVYTKAPSALAEELVAIPAPLLVDWLTQPSSDQQGWHAVALLSDGKSVTKYLVVKYARNEWADSGHVKFVRAGTLTVSL